MTITPLQDRVLIRRKAPPPSSALLVVPDTAKTQNLEGEVQAVGPGKDVKRRGFVKPSVAVGDEVLFARFEESDSDKVGDDLYLIPESHIVGIIRRQS